LPNRAPAAWILVSSLLFATLSALVKVAATGVSLPEIVFFRTLPAAIGLVALARIRGQRVVTAHWQLHAMRCVVGVMTMFVGFYAISRLPLATATTLEYTTPLFMLVYIILLARGRLTLQMSLAMVGGFAGVVVLLRPTVDTGQTLAFFAGLCSAALAGVVYVLIRKLSEAGEPAWRIVMWNSLVGTAVAAAMIPFSPPGDYNARTIAALAAVGIVGLGAQLSMTRAFATGPATLLASLQYSTVAFAALYGVVLWGDVLSVASVFGLSLIVLSGIVALRRTDKPMQVES
jgi:S-adenosylmethionine uptake transporter